MSTGYFLPEGGQALRHAHPYFGAPSEKLLWHPTDQVHDESPDPHIVHKSWIATEANWAKKNATLGQAMKRKLIDQAEAAYAQNKPAPTFNPIALPEISLTTPGDANGSVQIDADLLSKIDDIEILVVEAAKASNEASDDVTSIKRNISSYDNRLNALQTEVNELKARKNEDRAILITHDYGDRKIEVRLDEPKHMDFDKVWRWVRKLKPNRRNIWLAGPAGCGKSYLVGQIAKALNLPTDGYGTIVNMVKFDGFQNINGTYINTTFYDIWTKGGVLFLDECDGNIPEAMVGLNMALSNGFYAFPPDANDPTRGGKQPRHINCYIFATANTMGAGADAQYQRMKQDDAFMDRFRIVPMDYDPRLERDMVLPHAYEWVEVVQKTRQAARDASGKDGKSGFLISPRASEVGMDLLFDDTDNDLPPCPRSEVAEAAFGRYMKHEKWPHVGRHVIEWVNRDPGHNNTPSTSPSSPRNPLNSVNFTGR